MTPRRGRRYRKLARVTADDWPFYRPGVNPVAESSPASLEPAATEYCAAKAALDSATRVRRAVPAALHDGLATCRVALEIALAAYGRNKWHRSGDDLVGLWDRNGYSYLETAPAFHRFSAAHPY